MHPVFHVSLLRRYHAGGDGVEPPEPVVVDDEDQYEVETILQHRRHHGELEFLIRWKGFDASEDLWLPLSELESCAELVA